MEDLEDFSDDLKEIMQHFSGLQLAKNIYFLVESSQEFN